MRTFRLRRRQRLRGMAVVLTSISALGLAGCLPDFLSKTSADRKSHPDDATVDQVNRTKKSGLFTIRSESEVTATHQRKEGKEVEKLVTRATSASLQRGPGPSAVGSIVNRSDNPESVPQMLPHCVGLAEFFSALSRLESGAVLKPITILHLGD